MIHVLRDCEKAWEVWKRLLPMNAMQPFLAMDRLQWISHNLTHGWGRYMSKEWAVIFGITISILWQCRNKFILGKVSSKQSIVRQVWARVAETCRVFEVHSSLNPNASLRMVG